MKNARRRSGSRGRDEEIASPRQCGDRPRRCSGQAKTVRKRVGGEGIGLIRRPRPSRGGRVVPAFPSRKARLPMRKEGGRGSGGGFFLCRHAALERGAVWGLPLPCQTRFVPTPFLPSGRVTEAEREAGRSTPGHAFAGRRNLTREPPPPPCPSLVVERTGAGQWRKSGGGSCGWRGPRPHPPFLEGSRPSSPGVLGNPRAAGPPLRALGGLSLPQRRSTRTAREDCQAFFPRSARRISRCASRALMASRWSALVLERARPISNFSRRPRV